ncbi:MAG: hypothetical protein HY554_04890, partial [Elusimicrobia bacterium]|nr:hypothetical protein [Elusimicrobiota bacterium]
MLDPTPTLVGRSKPEPPWWQRVATDPRWLLGAVASVGVLGLGVWVLLPASQDETLSSDAQEPAYSYSDASGAKRGRKKRRKLKGLASVIPMELASEDPEEGAPLIEASAAPVQPARAGREAQAGLSEPAAIPDGGTGAQWQAPGRPFARKAFEAGAAIGGGRGSGAGAPMGRGSKAVAGQAGVAGSADGSASAGAPKAGMSAFSGGALAALAGGGAARGAGGAQASSGAPGAAAASGGLGIQAAGIASSGGPAARGGGASGGGAPAPGSGSSGGSG